MDHNGASVYSSLATLTPCTASHLPARHVGLCSVAAVHHLKPSRGVGKPHRRRSSAMVTVCAPSCLGASGTARLPLCAAGVAASLFTPSIPYRCGGAIMGSPTYGNVGESQPVLIMTNPIISPRTPVGVRRCRRPPPAKPSAGWSSVGTRVMVCGAATISLITVVDHSRP
jgi:hypothetical protein